MDTRASYDAVARRYAEELRHELDGKPLDRALLGLVRELAGDGVVADLGAGPGHVAAFLGGVALDLSPEMCALAETPSAAGDLTSLPLRSGCLAGAVCLYAVIHLSSGERALAYAEMARVLAPGAHVLVSFHVSDADPRAAVRTCCSAVDVVSDLIP